MEIGYYTLGVFKTEDKFILHVITVDHSLY
jgi:hypothetical protein